MKPMLFSEFASLVNEIACARESRRDPDSYDQARFYRRFIRDLARVVDDVNTYVVQTEAARGSK